MTASTQVTALGIDLGTTFSVAAQVSEAGLPAVLPNAEGSPTTPSVVLFDGKHAVVGAVAKEALATDPENVVQLVKRHIGSQWVFDHSGVSLTPEHISSLIIRKVHQDAELLAGSTNQVAITVPAYFNDTMRLATRRAGELAGVEVLGLLSEPTAAALAFGYTRRPSHSIGVVVDLGGGTFDVTVMEYDGADLTVRGTGGDPYLGGANFDKLIFDLFVEQFTAAHGLDINDADAVSLEEFTHVSQDWLTRANRAKHDLTVRDRAVASLQVAGLSHRAEITRDQFVAQSRVLVSEIGEKMLDVLSLAGVTPKDIDVVLAVGGSTRLPMVRDAIRDLLGTQPDTSVRPDEAVALGAALFAAQRQLELGGALALEPTARDYLERMTVNDVAAHSLGVSVLDKSQGTGGALVVATVLPRNTPLPFEKTRSFFTARANETSIVVPVLEGEETDPELCRRVGAVSIAGLPPNRPPHQRVDVTLRLDRDGILHVSARDLASGLAAETKIDHAGLVTSGSSEADALVRSLVVQ